MAAIQFDGLGFSKGGHIIFLRRFAPIEDAEINLTALAGEHEFEAVALVFAMLPEIQWHGFIHRRILEHLFHQGLTLRAESYQIITVQAGGAVDFVEVRPHLRLV